MLRVLLGFVLSMTGCECGSAESPSSTSSAVDEPEPPVAAGGESEPSPQILRAPPTEPRARDVRSGDVDGDGLADLLVGAVGAPPNPEHHTLVFRGHREGLEARPSMVLPGGGVGNDGGSIVRCDLDGDGRDEIALGDAAASRLTIHRGGEEAPAASIEGGEAGSGFARALACVDDIDGDGRADLAVGEPYHADRRGRVRVFAWDADASALREVTELSVDDRGLGEAVIGLAIGRAGDCDGDGRSDVLVGAPGTRQGQGAAFVFSASDQRLLGALTSNEPARLGGAVGPPLGPQGPMVVSATSTSTLSVYGCANGSLTPDPIRVLSHAIAEGGQPAAAVADLTGDALADLVVGAGGAVALYPADANGLQDAAPTPLSAPGAGPRFGHSVAVPGDLNGDGHLDLAVAAERKVYIYFGTGSGLSEPPLELSPVDGVAGGQPGDIGFATWLL